MNACADMLSGALANWGYENPANVLGTTRTVALKANLCRLSKRPERHAGGCLLALYCAA